MTEENYNTKLEKNIDKIVSQVSKFHPGLLRNFITYWSIKKSSTKVANSLMEKQKDTGGWLLLRKSNHEFRKKYGEDIAKELINIIEIKGASLLNKLG